MPGKGMFKVPDFNEETLLQIREQVFGIIICKYSHFIYFKFLGYFWQKP